MSILLPGPLACCRWELERRQMVLPSNDALRQIIERDTDLVDALNEFYGDATPDGGLDKVERASSWTCSAVTSLASYGRAPVGWTQRASVHGQPPARHGRGRLETGRICPRRLTP